jgi:glycosyltransferase involved in cell wall biosynthesis
VSIKNKSLVLFFSRKISLRIWVETGLFSREKVIYEELLRRGVVEEVYWLTYDPDDHQLALDLASKGLLHSSIKILQMPHFFNSVIGKNIYSILAPFLHFFALRDKNIFKTNQVDGAWTAVISKILTGRPVIFRFGYLLSDFLKSKKAPIIKWKIVQKLEEVIAILSDVVVVNNLRSEKMLRFCVPINTEIRLMPNFVDRTHFYDFNGTRKDEVVYVGRLDSHKNLLNLAKACIELNLRLNLFGEGELRHQLAQLGENVILHGIVPNDEVPKILNEYRYFALVSVSEGSPKALLEAMSCGCLCIGTDVEGIKEVIIDEQTGILSNDLSSVEIAKAFKLVQNRMDQNLMRSNSLRLIETSYEFSQFADCESSIINELLS